MRVLWARWRALVGACGRWVVPVGARWWWLVHYAAAAGVHHASWCRTVAVHGMVHGAWCLTFGLVRSVDPTA